MACDLVIGPHLNEPHLKCRRNGARVAGKRCPADPAAYFS
jgi:hypothetical protein